MSSAAANNSLDAAKATPMHYERILAVNPDGALVVDDSEQALRHNDGSRTNARGVVGVTTWTTEPILGMARFGA